jgi:hypothetical protein
MNRWMARLRGVLGLSVIGGGVGAIFGSVWAVVSQLMTFGTVFGFSFLSGALVWGVFGALAGGSFGVLLATLGARRSLDEIAIWRAGLWGGAAGAVVPIAVMAVANGALPPILGMLPFLGFCGGLGAILGSGLVAVAKYAPSEELSAASGRRRLDSGV